MPTNRSGRRGGSLVFLLTLAVIAGVGFAIWHGAGALMDPPGCEATVGDRTVGLEPDQSENAALIAAIGVSRGLPARAVSIGLATAYQESKIRNLAHGDRDSLGIFQQRPSQGWGTEEEIRDEHYAINAFYDALVKVKGYQTMRITEAAQRVQRSGFPEAYQAHAADARALASALTGYSTGGAFSCVVPEPEGPGSAAEVRRSLTEAYGELDVARTGSRQDLVVRVGDDEAGQRLGWSVAAYLLAFADRLEIESVAFDGRTWRAGDDSGEGWVPAKASATQVLVGLG